MLFLRRLYERGAEDPLGLGAVINFVSEYGKSLSDPANFTPPGRRRRREELEGPLSTERRSEPMGTGLNYSIRDYLRLCNGGKLVNIYSISH